MIFFICDEKTFKKPSLAEIQVDQLNVASRHDDVGRPSELEHPWATHKLLGYSYTTSSFTKKNSNFQWIGPTLTFKAKAHLFV